MQKICKFLLQRDVLQNSPKSQQTFRQLMQEILSKKFQKSSNLVTLLTLDRMNESGQNFRVCTGRI